MMVIETGGKYPYRQAFWAKGAMKCGAGSLHKYRGVEKNECLHTYNTNNIQMCRKV
jgi:hypothetical protein